jgi:hypothetical protein
MISIGVPFWLVTIVLASGPAWTITGSVRRRRSRLENLCQQCGYDLRATPDRCPECGAVPARVSNHRTDPLRVASIH